MSIENLRVRQELIGNNLMEVVDDYPDQLRVVIDELVSHLNDNQLDQIEDLIVNNYGDIDPLEITPFQEELEVKKYIQDNPITPEKVTQTQLKSIKGKLLWTDQTCPRY